MHPNSLHTHTHTPNCTAQSRQESDFPVFSPPSFFPLFLLRRASMSGFPLARSPSSTFQTERRSTEACDFHQTIDPRSVPSVHLKPVFGLGRSVIEILPHSHTHTHKRSPSHSLTFQVTAGGRRKTFLGFTAHQF